MFEEDSIMKISPKEEWLCLDGIQITGCRNWHSKRFLIANDDAFIKREPKAFKSQGEDTRIARAKRSKSARETPESDTPGFLGWTVPDYTK